MDFSTLQRKFAWQHFSVPNCQFLICPLLITMPVHFPTGTVLNLLSHLWIATICVLSMWPIFPSGHLSIHYLTETLLSSSISPMQYIPHELCLDIIWL